MDAGVVPTWKKYVNSFLAGELSALTKYYDQLVQWQPREDDSGMLLAAMDCPIKYTVGRGEQLTDLNNEKCLRTAVLVNGTFNHDFDIQGLLIQLKSKLSRTSRLVLLLYNPYLRWLYYLANRLGIRNGELPSTFLTRVDLQNIAKVAGFEIVHQRLAVYCPWRLFGLGDVVNRVLPLVPLIRWLSLTSIVVLRPLLESSKPGISCIIPARNERGNIENALKRFPDLACDTEIIFVEGHSSDGTWEEIQRVATLYGQRFRIQTLKQTGKGKADAVRLGFDHATEHLLVILDADLSMPPVISSKPFLAAIYREWYSILATELPPGRGAVLELGSGAGSCDHYIPGVVTSDVFFCGGVQLVADAQQMPFEDGSLRAIVFTDVMHHIPDVRRFFSEAARCLRPGGRILMIEPWVTPWSRFIYERFHHEPFLPDAENWSFPSTGPLSGANGAIPWIVFERDRHTFESEFPQLVVEQIRPFLPFRYLISGGIAMRSLMPGFTHTLWMYFEQLLEPCMSSLAMFAFLSVGRR